MLGRVLPKSTNLPPRRTLARARQLLGLVLATACQDQLPPGPKIDAISPNSAPEGSTAQTLISGSGFLVAVSTNLDDTSAPKRSDRFRVKFGQLELATEAVHRLSDRQIGASVPSDLPPGTYDVSVGTPTDRWATLTRAFTVTTSDKGTGGSTGGSGNGNGGAPASAGTAGGLANSAGNVGSAGQASFAGAAANAGNGSAGAGDAGSSGAAGAAERLAPGAYDCPQYVDSATLAIYFFQSDLTDSAGNHTGNYAGSTPPQYLAAPPNCGTGLALSSQYYVYIGDSPDWDLDRGSLDFWFYPSSIPDFDPYGILSRDANGSVSRGHITIYQAGNTSGRIVVRMQDGSDLFVCSDAPVTLGSWMHIGLNFGPPQVELYINGTRQSYTGLVPLYGSWETCSIEGAHGIAGNSNFWVIGASADLSTEGDTNNVRGYAAGAGINALRISDQRRDFGQ